MPHRIIKSTDTFHDYPQLIINTYVRLIMYLKKFGKEIYIPVQVHFVGNGPSSYEKSLPCRGVTLLRNTGLDAYQHVSCTNRSYVAIILITTEVTIRLKCLSVNTSSANSVARSSVTPSHNGTYNLPANPSSHQTGKLCAPSGGSQADTPFS
jgi:hypothetical protein